VAEEPVDVVETVEPVAAEPAAVEPVTIRFATLSGPEFTDGYQPIVDEWNAAHPEIQVAYETYPWGDYWAKIPASLAAGNPPDVLWTGTGEVDATWMERGVFAPLDEFLDGASPLDRADWDPLAWQYGVYGADQNVYLLNTIINLPALAFNKDLFDAAGVACPDETWTWDSLLQAGLAVTTVSMASIGDADFDLQRHDLGNPDRFW
jgi:multiple sugar transport system substrate-binding protein